MTIRQNRGVARNRVPIICGVTLVFLLYSAFTSGHGEDSHGNVGELDESALGTVSFDTSCLLQVKNDFNRAVALLHSFWYSAAIEAFEGVLTKDAQCAMAEWGIAMAHWGNPLASKRSKEMLKLGADAAERALGMDRVTDRERAYINTVAELYRNFEATVDLERGLAYEKKMEKVSAAYPDDAEARIFYAVALNGTADLLDKSYANLLKAAEILEPEFELQPNHPGIAHYIIHSYDVPPLAHRALAAAKKYAAIAPAAPHALHMPSHTFTRLGYWRESISTNLRSEKAALNANSPAEALHALDYMTYAYLQIANDAEARQALTRTKEIAAMVDPSDRYVGAGAFAAAAVPARVALESRDWPTAAALQYQPIKRISYIDAMTDYAVGVGSAYLGRLDDAQAALQRVQAAETATSDNKYWAGRVAIMGTTLGARIALIDGDKDKALTLMREAVRLGELSNKSARSPGPIAPPRELYAEMLLELGHPEQAFDEFQRTLEKEPNRFWSISGSARSAAAAGRIETAKAISVQLVEMCDTDASNRPALRQAVSMAAGNSLSLKTP